MFILRDLAEPILMQAKVFPVIALLGPRQSGKTRLSRELFADYKYFSLENPQVRQVIMSDPSGFLHQNFGAGVIIDEFQHEPTLLSYIQEIVDSNRRPGYFVLTGSHNFLMNQAISQSLAGRVALFTLLPLSWRELSGAKLCGGDWDEMVLKGNYPELFVTQATSIAFYSYYIQTYVERDVRQLLNIGSLSTFQKFMALCAGRVGQILNVASLADDCGISVITVNSWLSVLEASYIIFRVQPHFNNFSRRIIKAPKLYFYDSGLVAYLLNIHSIEQLRIHYLRGAIIESAVMSELHKAFYNQNLRPSIYFWRDSHGHEVDCLLDYGTELIPIEIKAAKTTNQRMFEALAYWCQLAGISPSTGFLIYGGDMEVSLASGCLVNWQNAGRVVKKRAFSKT